MSNPSSPNLEEVIGNVVEEILQKRAKEVQREMAEEESQENSLDIMLEEIEVVVATPVPGPTQMAGPNRNLGMLV